MYRSGRYLGTVPGHVTMPYHTQKVSLAVVDAGSLCNGTLYRSALYTHSVWYWWVGRQVRYHT